MMSLNKYKRCTFQSQNAARKFMYLWRDQLASEMCHWHFHFILPIMLDKTAFMSADRAAFVYSCSVRDFRAQIIWFSSGLQSANHLIKFGTSERRAQIIWFSSGLQSANHLVQFGTSELRVQIIWFSSGLQSSERQSFNSVRDFRAQSTNHLIQFGTSEHRAPIIWFSSGLQSAEHESFDSVRDFRAQSANHLIQFGTSERESFGSARYFRAQSACVCMYIYCIWDIKRVKYVY